MTFPKLNKEISKYINNDVFINNLNIPLYLPFNNNLEDFSIILEKLDILLKVPHREFWCHIFFDMSILCSLQSFCDNAKRLHELALNEIEMHELEYKLHKKYCKLIFRMLSNKEVNIPSFSDENFGLLVYDNFIVDIPFLFDICSLYGDEIPELIIKLMSFIFKCQPNYFSDLKAYVLHTIKLIDEKIISAISATSEKGVFSSIKTCQLSEKQTNDLLNYVIDLCRSWNIMLNSVRLKSEIFIMLFEASFHKSLEKMFEKLIPFMQDKIDKFETSDPEKLKTLLSVTCYYIINTWRIMFEVNFVSKLVERNSLISSRSSEENYTLIAECISVITSCQEHPIFADAMYLMYPIRDDFDLIHCAVKCDKDEYYSSFVNDSVTEICRDVDTRQTTFSSKSLCTNGHNSPPPSETAVEFTDMNVSNVRDIFPNLSTQEITAYLKCYNCTAENLVDALLAGAVDEEFVKQTANRMDNGILSKKNSRDISILSNHHNIYDGDDLDIGRITTSQLHIGKRQMQISERVDPKLRNMILDIIVQQNEEEEKELELLGNSLTNLVYDDEFDDVYGISHDGVVDNNNVEESISEIDKPKKAFRISNDAKKNSIISGDVSEANNAPQPTIMEPSKIKFSTYDKRQHKKNKFHDGPSKNSTGTANSISSNHRQGSHAPKESTYRKDHRPKAERYKTSNND